MKKNNQFCLQQSNIVAKDSDILSIMSKNAVQTPHTTQQCIKESLLE